ncbi:putative adhesin P123 [Spiroplasma kunkelii CR2-3x]|uniref:Putative adhesin P123 n=1 Tax=Spiroplasma kunkelii CR2-3x TaxID=273035 RepID=A0A0K2JHK5_SPIKU|nr:hypothetical protein [Spiroplasma kunkelii]ALA97902.1 putative adhesin P123 [Spiroplasma kunkelii CR2-3x]
MAKFIKPNGNVQAWNSVIKTSDLDYDLLEETTFFYPQAVLPPNPFTYKPYTVNILDAKTNKPLKTNITVNSHCINRGNLFLDNLYNSYYELEIDLKQINPTITTLSQLLNAYSLIQFNNLNNLYVWCIEPDIKYFIPNRNVNLLARENSCGYNLGLLSNATLKKKVYRNLTMLNLMVF